MDEDFDKETERMLEEALKEIEDESDIDEEEENEEDDESEQQGNENGDSEEENDNGSSGDGHEDEHKTESEEKFSPIEVEVAGHKITINSKEEMLAYIKRGASTFEKKPETFVEEKTILEQAGLTADDLKLIADAKAGSKEAIALIAKRAGVDILDVENEMADAYKQQTQYYVSTDVDEIAREILNDAEHASEFKKIASSLPADFMQEVTSNAKDLKAFSSHIKSGIAQKVIPLAINAQIVNGGSFIDNYNKIGLELMTKEQTKQQEKTREQSDRVKEMRKRAGSGGGETPQKKELSGEDIWEMSDEEFSKLDVSKLK